MNRNRLLGLNVWYSHKVVKKRVVKDVETITSHPAVLVNVETGIIVGERWLPDGITRYGWGEDPGEFTRTGSTHCFLVVSSVHREAVKTSVDHTRILGELGIPFVMDPLVTTLIGE